MNSDSSHGQVHAVSFANFESVVDENSLVILDFWANWCQPCRVFDPIFKRMAEAYPQIFFGKVDTEAAPDLAAAFLVRSIPTLIAFKNGDLIFEQSGLVPAEQFENLMTQMLDEQISGQ